MHRLLEMIKVKMALEHRFFWGIKGAFDIP